MEFTLDKTRVRNGDIILTSVPGNVLSGLIRFVTHSNYSHALMVADASQGLCIEAIGSVGVRHFSIRRFLIRDQENVKILRYRNASPESLALVCRTVNSHLHKKYSEIGAAASQVPTIKVLPLSGAFCSYIIAEAFERQNLKLVDKESEKVDPGDIEKSCRLEDVTDEVLVSYSGNADADGMWCLDEGLRTETFSDRETRATQTVVATMQPLLRKHGFNDSINNIEDIRKCFFTLPMEVSDADDRAEIDAALSEALITSHYLDLPNLWREGNQGWVTVGFDMYNALKAQVIDVNAYVAISKQLLDAQDMFGADWVFRQHTKSVMGFFVAELFRLGFKSDSMRLLWRHAEDLADLSNEILLRINIAIDLLTDAVGSGARPYLNEPRLA